MLRSNTNLPPPAGQPSWGLKPSLFESYSTPSNARPPSAGSGSVSDFWAVDPMVTETGHCHLARTETRCIYSVTGEHTQDSTRPGLGPPMATHDPHIDSTMSPGRVPGTAEPRVRPSSRPDPETQKGPCLRHLRPAQTPRRVAVRRRRRRPGRAGSAGHAADALGELLAVRIVASAEADRR